MVDSIECTGANGGVIGNAVRVIAKYPDMTADTRGTDNHETYSIHLATAGGVTLTTSGEVIVFMYQDVHHEKNKSIHYSHQIEYCNNKVDDISIKSGGS